MTAEQVIFLVTGALILASAVMVVSARKLLHSALWLVAALFGVAILYALLRANFLVVIQIVVYIGAIAILFIFAVMLTRKEMRDLGPQSRAGWWLVVLLAMLLIAGLLLIIFAFPNVNRLPASIPQGLDTLERLGEALVTANEYLLPFEVASILLLAALVGAVYIASGSKTRE